MQVSHRHYAPGEGLTCPECGTEILSIGATDHYSMIPCSHMLLFDMREALCLTSRSLTMRAARHGDMLAGMGDDGHLVLRPLLPGDDPENGFAVEVEDDGEIIQANFSLYQILASFQDVQIVIFHDPGGNEVVTIATAPDSQRRDLLAEHLASGVGRPVGFMQLEIGFIADADLFRTMVPAAGPSFRV